MPHESSCITEMLAHAVAGEHQHEAALFAAVYDDLRHLAAQHIASEKPGQTLQPTALVHEAYLRLFSSPSSELGLRWKNRRQFFAAATEAMRRILIESARRKQAAKRGGGRTRVVLDPDRVAEPEVAHDLLALHEALQTLAHEEPLVAELVQLRYFGGLTLRECAEILEIAPRTADDYWAYARAWLLTALDGQNG